MVLFSGNSVAERPVVPHHPRLALQHRHRAQVLYGAAALRRPRVAPVGVHCTLRCTLNYMHWRTLELCKFERSFFYQTLGMFRYMFFLHIYKVSSKIYGIDFEIITFPQNDPQIIQLK